MVLASALVLPATEGGYSAQVRVLEVLSGNAWVWESPVEVSAGGTGASPLLVGSSALQLREGGEVAVLASEPASLAESPIMKTSFAAFRFSL